MSKLIVTMGISGSGKSRLSAIIKGDHPDYFRVNMDELRKIYTGGISNQSQNNRVANDAFAITEYLLFKGCDVIFDSTATRSDTRNKLLALAKKYNADATLVVLKDSEDVELCRSRVRKDILSKIDRSNTAEDASIMQRQHDQFALALQAIKKEGWTSIQEI